MGAKAGRKGARSYNILTYGVGAWRKYLDKKRRKSAKKAALDEEMEAWQQAGAEAYWRVEEEWLTCACCESKLSVGELCTNEDCGDAKGE